MGIKILLYSLYEMTLYK